MRNEAADIVQDATEEAASWKEKARAAGNATWDATRLTYQQLQEKTAAYTKATDECIRENPYVSMGIALGVGVVLGFLLTGNDSDE